MAVKSKRVVKRLLAIGLVFILQLIPASPSAGQSNDLPDSAYVSGVAGRAQTYSLSCESRSAADWAAFWGVSFTELEFLANLPSSDNPETGFVGRADDVQGQLPPRSYGVHAAPVAALLRLYGLQAEAYRGLSWDDLRVEISAGRPAIVWVIGLMWRGAPQSYTASDGSNTVVARFEHTMILTGYAPNYVQVVDAYTGLAQTYPLSSFLASWAVLGNMAVLGEGAFPPSSPPPSEPPLVEQERPVSEEVRYVEAGLPYYLPLLSRQNQDEPQQPEETAPGETPAQTYTVQRGDYLIELANRFGLAWQDLAELNGILYPYVIYPGQVLSLE